MVIMEREANDCGTAAIVWNIFALFCISGNKCRDSLFKNKKNHGFFVFHGFLSCDALRIFKSIQNAINFLLDGFGKLQHSLNRF